MVDSALEHLLGAFRVAVVPAEHAEGLALVNLDDEFAHFVGSARLAFGIHDVHAVARRGLADGTRTRFGKAEVARSECELCLAVTFLHADACLLVELVVDV